MSGDDVLSKGLITAESVPARYRPITAIPNQEAIRGKIAIANVPKGQVLVQGMFVDPIVAQETAAKRIPAGQVGVTVRIDDVTGVAGLIMPGDKVNILSLEPGTDVVHTMYTNVDVLFIGQTPAPTPGSPAAAVATDSFLVTLAVPPLAAERIVWASHHEHGIHLTLVPPGSQPGKVPTVNNANAWTGGATPSEG
jgi:pilus assembly protein CpaB